MIEEKLITETIGFIRSLYGSNETIPLHEPRFSSKDRLYVLDAIDSTFVSSVGKYVDRFESEFAEYVGAKKAVAVVNGTAGLQVALQLAGVKEGEEVLTQALTFVATANAIRYLNGHPVFLDVDRRTLGLSPQAVKRFLEEFGEKKTDGVYNKYSSRRIAAIMPMHTFGFPADVHGLMELSINWGIPLVEDAAEGLGTKYHRKHLGTFGKFGVFSFNGNKIITTGGGGMIVTDDLELATKAKHITTTAKVPHSYEFHHDELGYNFRLPNLNAALGCAQLESLNDFIKSKRRIAHAYSDFFKDLNVPFIREPEGSRSNYWLNSILCQDRSERDLFLTRLNDAGIGCRPIWQLMFRLPMFRNCQRDEQINAIWLEDRIVNLPSSSIVG